LLEIGIGISDIRQIAARVVKVAVRPSELVDGLRLFADFVVNDDVRLPVRVDGLRQPILGVVKVRGDVGLFAGRNGSDNGLVGACCGPSWRRRKCRFCAELIS